MKVKAIKFLFKSFTKPCPNLEFFGFRKGGGPTTDNFGSSILMKKPGSVGAGGVKCENLSRIYPTWNLWDMYHQLFQKGDNDSFSSC